MGTWPGFDRFGQSHPASALPVGEAETGKGVRTHMLPTLSLCALTLKEAQEKAPLTLPGPLSVCPTRQTGRTRPQLPLCCADLRRQPTEILSLPLKDTDPSAQFEMPAS